MEEEMLQQPSTTAITHVEAIRVANARAVWQGDLMWLGTPQAFGHRNRRLCSVARNGLAAGLAPEQVVQEMKRAGGTAHPLTEQECRRAVGTVLHGETPGCRAEARSDGGAFFRAMINAGATAPLELKPLAKYGRRSERWKHQHAIFTACAAEADTLFWTGLGKYAPRDRKSLAYACDLNGQRPYRQFIIPNPMTGAPGLTGDGKRSWACKATVATAPLVICEFDHLPPERQLAFWSGVIATGSLDVRSLVWSGSKSYHALVKVPEGRDRAEYVAYLRSVLPGIDPAPMHAAGLTRLAGGINEKTVNLQRLVFCAQ